MLAYIALKLLKHGSFKSLEILLNKALKLKYPHWAECFSSSNYIIEVHCFRPNKQFFIKLNSEGIFFNNQYLYSPDVLIKCDAVCLLSACLTDRQNALSADNIHYFINEDIKSQLHNIWQQLQQNKA